MSGKVIGVLLLLLMLAGRANVGHGEELNRLSDGEKDAGWRLLFDGQTTAGWRGYKSQSMPASWKIEHGSLLSRREPGDTAGDIVTVDQYDDFELRLDWKMTKGGNSGVVYRATEQHDNVWESGPEFQILDNAGHLDGLNTLASAGACYAVFAPAKDATRPLGQWNQTRIVAQGKHVEHWLNGEKLLEYDIDSQRWQAACEDQQVLPDRLRPGKLGPDGEGTHCPAGLRRSHRVSQHQAPLAARPGGIELTARIFKPWDGIKP